MVRHKIVNPPPKMRHLWKVKTYCSKGDFTMSRKITDCKQTGSLSVSKQKLFIYSIGQNVCPCALEGWSYADTIRYIGQLQICRKPYSNRMAQ